jgi:hypothetical protein
MKPSWLAFAFAAGVGVGVVVTRVSMEVPAGPITATTQVPAPLAALPDTPASSTAADVAPKPAAATTAGEPVASTAPPVPLAAASSDSGGAAVDDASVQHIDAGPVFNKVIERPSQPGFENQLGDAHRALERETRDDGWAYTMEAEIQNAMGAKASRATTSKPRAPSRRERRSSSTASSACARGWRSTRRS